MTEDNDVRFPIGRFDPPAAPHTRAERAALIDRIAATPARLREAVRGLSPEQLDTPYRAGGWTVRQVVHHLPDSHANAYVRLKLGLTEEQPTIKPYDEARWAELPDTATVDPEVSLRLLEALHERFVAVWRTMEEGQFARTLLHPEMGALSLDTMLALYAWHGDHHVAHLTRLRERMGW